MVGGAPPAVWYPAPSQHLFRDTRYARTHRTSTDVEDHAYGVEHQQTPSTETTRHAHFARPGTWSGGINVTTTIPRGLAPTRSSAWTWSPRRSATDATLCRSGPTSSWPRLNPSALNAAILNGPSQGSHPVPPSSLRDEV